MQIKSILLSGVAAQKKKKTDMMDLSYVTRSVTFMSDARLHASRKCSIMRGGMSGVCERFLSEGLFIACQMRQGEESGPR